MNISGRNIIARPFANGSDVELRDAFGLNGFDAPRWFKAYDLFLRRSDGFERKIGYTNQAEDGPWFAALDHGVVERPRSAEGRTRRQAIENLLARNGLQRNGL